MTDLITCYDAVAIDTIPGTPEACLGYVDVWDGQTGLSNYQSVRERWPEAIVVPITVGGTHALTYDGRRPIMVDMETGDLTPAGAAQWCYEELQLGAPSWGEIIPWWAAWWNLAPDLRMPPPPWPQLPTPVGHQYERVGPPPGRYDLSVVLRSWLLNPSPPTPYCQSSNGQAMADALAAVGLRMGEPPPPQPKETEAMFVRNPGPGNVVGANGAELDPGAICLCDGAGAVNMGTDWPSIVADYQSASVPLVLHQNASLLTRFAKIAVH